MLLDDSVFLADRFNCLFQTDEMTEQVLTRLFYEVCRELKLIFIRLSKHVSTRNLESVLAAAGGGQTAAAVGRIETALCYHGHCAFPREE